jgi:threonine/homoserine/homoserine lactone efflux protein
LAPAFDATAAARVANWLRAHRRIVYVIAVLLVYLILELVQGQR